MLVSMDGHAGPPEPVIPGRYRILPFFGPTPGFYAASILLGDREVMGQIVDLDSGSLPLRIVYKPNPGTVRGTVESGEGATVLLLSQLDAFVARGSKCGPGGKFELSGVAPGNYTAVAFDHIGLVPADPSILRGIISSGVSVRVEEGLTVSIELRVTAWPQ